MLSDRYHTFSDDEPGEWDHRPHAYKVLRVLGTDALDGETVLDAGCRDGWWSQWLLDAGAMVTAIDVYDSPYRPKNITFERVNIYDLARTAYKFDVVFCGDVLQHVENPLGLLRVLHHVCRERLVLMTDVMPELGGMAKHNYKSRDVPLGWGPLFVLDMMEAAGWKHCRESDQLQLVGRTSMRRVGVFTALADTTFDLGRLREEYLTSV